MFIVIYNTECPVSKGKYFRSTLFNTIQYKKNPKVPSNRDTGRKGVLDNLLFYL